MLSAEKITQALGGRRGLAPCPAHDDQNPSLSISEKAGKLLVHCHAGCPQEAVIGALRSRGLWGCSQNTRVDSVIRASPPKKVEGDDYLHDYVLPRFSQACCEDSSVAGHPYCQRKQIGHAFGARRGRITGRVVGDAADCLLLPNCHWDGDLVGIEAINPEGKKQTWGRKGSLILGHPEAADLIHIAEGWATMYALSKIFPQRFGGVVAFGKNALDSVADEAGRRYSGTVIVHAEQGKRDAWDVWNAGQSGAYRSLVLGVRDG